MSHDNRAAPSFVSRGIGSRVAPKRNENDASTGKRRWIAAPEQLEESDSLPQHVAGVALAGLVTVGLRSSFGEERIDHRAGGQFKSR